MGLGDSHSPNYKLQIEIKKKIIRAKMTEVSTVSTRVQKLLEIL